MIPSRAVPPSRQRWFFALLVVAAALFASACGRDGPGGGANLPAAGPPQRIVALGATGVYETLIDLGVYDRIVAVGSRFRYPGSETKVQIVSDDAGVPNIEAILALSPDLVIVKPAMRVAVERVGLRVLEVPNEDEAANIGRLVRQLGDALGVPERAEEVVRRMDASVARVRERTRNLPRVRVYYEEPGVLRTHARGSFAHDLLELCGGENVAGPLTLPHPVVNAEMVVGADPEVIILGAFTDSPAACARRPGWSDIAAVRNGRVHQIVPEDRLLWSSRWAERGERLLLPWIHPETVSGGK